MKPNYRYEHKVVIDVIRQEIWNEFIQYENYKNWQPSLDKVELKEGSFDEENHLVHLIYKDKDGNEVIMKETILDYSPPHKLVHQYQMGSTINIQYNYFESFGAKTMWTCVTEFYFEGDPPASFETFKQATHSSLLVFKEYLESK